MKLKSTVDCKLCACLLVALFTGGAIASAAKEVREEFHQTYPLNEAGQISLDNVNGKVRIVAWDQKEVKVDAVKRAKSQEHLDAVKIDVSAQPDRLRIKTKYPDAKSGWFGWTKNNSTSVDY